MRAGVGERGDGGAQWARHALSRALSLLSLLAILHIVLAPLARASAPAPASVEQLAAELKATFGDVVQLCVNVGDDGSKPGAPAHHGDGDCPLCCLQATAAVVPPDVTELPALRLVAADVVFAATDFAPPPPARASPAQPRAPPSKS